MFLGWHRIWCGVHTCFLVYYNFGFLPLFQNAFMRECHRSYEESPIKRTSRRIVGRWHYGTIVSHAYGHISLWIGCEYMCKKYISLYLYFSNFSTSISISFFYKLVLGKFQYICIGGIFSFLFIFCRMIFR